MSNRTYAIAFKAILLPIRICFKSCFFGREAPEKTTLAASFKTLPNLLGRFLAQGLLPVRRWLDQIEIRDVAIAHAICRLIPAQCPFERDIYVFDHKIGHIPPLCKLNPFYEEVVGLRFRALCYLADECGEDVGCYV